MKVPLLNVTPPPEFGELKETPSFHDHAAMDRDFTYVPGFSELRRARDTAIAEVRAGRRSASDVPTLPMNFRWARAQNKKGEPDSRKVIRAGNRGYIAVTKDQVGEGKLVSSLPAGAFVAADGTVRQGDTQLMVCTAENAARNAFHQRVATETLTKGAMEGFEAAMRTLPGTRGAAPTVTQESGPRVQAELSPRSATVTKASR